MQNAFKQPQSILVLGGTSDIAYATCAQLRGTANEFILAGRDEKALEKNANKLLAAGAKSAQVVLFDATDTRNVKSVIDECFLKAQNEIDLVLVAVGSLGVQEDIENSSQNTSDLFTINTTWPVSALAVLREKLIAQGTGHIAVITSVAGVRIRRANYVYGATKAGLDAYTLGLRESLREYGITVQVVRPGFVRSKMTKGLKEAPFTTDLSSVAANLVEGLQSQKPVIWSPPKLKMLYILLNHLPDFIWRRLPS